jgi:hypothetical protein
MRQLRFVILLPILTVALTSYAQVFRVPNTGPNSPGAGVIDAITEPPLTNTAAHSRERQYVVQIGGKRAVQGLARVQIISDEDVDFTCTNRLESPQAGTSVAPPASR